MAYTELSNLTDWHLVHPEQDIRGWKVQDNAGNMIGRVDDLLVDTDSELVERIRLDNGDEFPARDIEIGDQVVHVRSTESSMTAETTEPIVKTYRDTRVHRVGSTTASTMTGAAAGMGSSLSSVTGGKSSSTLHDYDSYTPGFRSHYDTTYGSSGQGYHLYEPAYRYGYTAGTNESYRNREFNDLEPELRRDYERQHGEGTWERIKDAVSHAFSSSRGPRRS